MAQNGSSNPRAAARAAVITGASTGIGEACALRLDRMGWRVFAGVRKHADGEALRTRASARLTPLIIDVTDEATIRAAAEEVARAVGDGGIAGLVNNAGIAVAGPLEFIPMAELRDQLEINVIGQVAITQAFMPLLRKGGGRVVNMGSIGGRMATAFLGPYNASKFALEAITDALRQELRPWGIDVAIIEPGSIATPIWDKGVAGANERRAQMPARGERLYGAAIDAMIRASAKLGAKGIPPDEVAKAVAHALTAQRPKTRYIVGRDARLQAAVRKFVPDRLLDRLVFQQMGLPKDAPADVPEPEPARV